MQWSNGQAEGQINRLKTLKRAMYGRACLTCSGRECFLYTTQIEDEPIVLPSIPAKGSNHQTMGSNTSKRPINQSETSARYNQHLADQLSLMEEFGATFD
jgi:hypothetical protein